MSTALSTSRSRTRHRIPSRLKVRKPRGALPVAILSPLPLPLILYLHGHPVRKLSEILAQVKDEQSYIVVRERTHRNTAESTNSRVKWWNVFIIGVVIGESVFQVWWLRRFFEVKRVV